MLQCKADDDPQKVLFLEKEDMPAELQTFRNAMLDRLRRLFTVFGGPEQYLAWRFYATEDLQAFSTWLNTTFPPDPYSTSYVVEAPRHTDEECLLHVSDLGFHRSCSTKPPPQAVVAIDLCDEMITHGCITQGDVYI